MPILQLYRSEEFKVGICLKSNHITSHVGERLTGYAYSANPARISTRCWEVTITLQGVILETGSYDGQEGA